MVNDSIRIDGYRGFVKDEILDIPSQLEYDGKMYDVKYISDYAFSNNNYGKSIKKVIFPETLEEIGSHAFSDSDLIEELDFSNAKSLKKIGKSAFAIEDDDKESNLTNFELPENLNYIDDYAFYNNDKLTNINLPYNTTFGEGVFAKTNISKISGNKYYFWEKDCLILKNERQVELVYANPNVSDFDIPEDVTSISAFAFMDYDKLTSVKLNNVSTIGRMAFANSTLETITNTNKVKNANLSAFLGTKWLDNKTKGEEKQDFLTLGKVLLAYLGNEENVVVKEGIERIGQDAFFYSKNVKTVELPTTIKSIGVNAFIYNETLDSVLINSSKAPMLDGICFNENTKIIVKDIYLNDYKNGLFFDGINNEITTLRITLKFKIDDEIIEKEVAYGSYLKSYPTIENKKGYTFVGFIDENGKLIKKNSMILFTSNMTLTPYYEEISNEFDSMYVMKNSFRYPERRLVLDISNFDVEIEGKEFLGWYVGDELVVDRDGRVLNELFNGVAKPKYQLRYYNVEFDPNGGEILSDNIVKVYSIENPLMYDKLPRIEKYGYVFKYWIIEDLNIILEEDAHAPYDISYTIDTLYIKAIYEDAVIVTNPSSDTYGIQDEITIVDMRNANPNDSYYFTVYNTVLYLTIIGSSNKEYNLCINVRDRDNAIVLGFENMNIVREKNWGFGISAIYAESDSNYILYLKYKGKNKIVGGDGGDGITERAMPQATNNEDGQKGGYGYHGYDGGCGIVANHVVLQAYNRNAFVTIKGGNGGRGGNGQKGQKGSNGVNPPRGWFFNPIHGDNGGNGGLGGEAGNGGNGGYAIKVNDSIGTIKLSKIKNSNGEYTFNLEGGNGGNGGAGGAGGDGGNGCSDVSANIFNGVGNPGKGGNGGDGGLGGNGGNGMPATNATNEEDINYYGGKAGSAGEGGRAGVGGTSGSGGDAGALGPDGANGSDGNDGTRGNDGITARNNEGNAKIYVVLQEYYTERFKQEYLLNNCKNNYVLAHN